MKSSPSNNYQYNKQLRSKANELRKHMTKAEACLWKYVLRAGSMKGFTFRRQRPVLNYIADFMCKELLLIIEVDGITHSHEDVASRDISRQKDLENAGFTVLRFTDEQVLHHIHKVYEAIEDKVAEIMKVSGIAPKERSRRRK
ncbi:endonuclease domain-containing protein [Catalinimonas niigatensis]|uniref:endonuclease domain-containing protein n=1 Tax=Catalinimonas niigatensis TaxID=1397264 RepID=UPI002665A237|nr:endonuclease domain-containing protein [Catalinimonas niigatensis]WPP49093.1 endonuclease domain-containing protein [Catalinimonas niigatensis]